MDNPRLLLIIALSVVGLMLFTEWQNDYGPKPVRPQTAQSAPDASGGRPGAAAPQRADNGAGTSSAPTAAEASAPKTDAPQTDAARPAARPAAPGATVSGEHNRLPTAQQVEVETDTLRVVIDTHGGDIREAKLRRYPVALDQPNNPFVLMTDQGARLFVSRAGFELSDKTGTGDAPNHESIYTASQTSYRLPQDQETLTVALRWSSPSGVQVSKEYTFTRGSHLIRLDYRVRNGSDQPWNRRFYRELHRTQFAEENQSMFIITYMGGVIYTPEERYEKVSFADMQDEDLLRDNIQGGWVAMMQHYFLGAWVPPQGQHNIFYSMYDRGTYRYTLGMITRGFTTIAPGGEQSFQSQLYVGPKLQDDLAQIAEGLDLTVDYGIFTVLAKPLFWLLSLFHTWVGNWGWAIIMLTLVIKLVFYKLSETSYRSMAKMRKLQPRMQAFKERYGDDKQKMQQAIMDMYRKEKVNPLGGCLPILIQIPVFIALYWVLLEAVELRQAPFMLWIDDLAARDPYFVLPLIMGISMFVQQKLNPAPPDPIQAKVMMILPVVLTVFFIFFPAGLVLYWVVNNILSIAQQWLITKRIEAGKE